MGLIVIVILLLALVGSVSVVRRIKPTLKLALRELYRALVAGFFVVKVTLRQALIAARSLIGLVASTLTLGALCVRKVTPVAISTVRKSFVASCRRQAPPVQVSRPIATPQPVVTLQQAKTVRGPSRFLATLASPIGPACILAVFAAMSGSFRDDLDRLFKNGRPSVIKPETAKHVLTPDEIILAADRPPLPEAELMALRPKWISEGEVTNGDVRYVVLSSQLWSTVEEARHTLVGQATEILRKDFEQRHKGPFIPFSNRALNMDRLVEIAVKEQHLESVEQDFGKYTSPMYRLWWRLEISPIVRTELFPDWKAATTQNKVIVIGVVMAAVTFLANIVSVLSMSARPQQPLGDKLAIRYPSPSMN